MSQVGQEGQAWPGGLTYVFQGTVAETADAGTHVVTLTVTPGVGNEMQVLYGEVMVGNTATAQVTSVYVTDGTNELTKFLSNSGTTANLLYVFPANLLVTTNSQAAPGPSLIVSGGMQLVVKVSTAAVSVTQTFAVVCRIHGAKPTATLNDTVGAFVATTNTDAVF